MKHSINRVAKAILSGLRSGFFVFSLVMAVGLYLGLSTSSVYEQLSLSGFGVKAVMGLMVMMGWLLGSAWGYWGGSSSKSGNRIAIDVEDLRLLQQSAVAFEQSPTALVLLDATGNILTLNQQARQFLGTPPTALTAKPASTQSTDSHDSRAENRLINLCEWMCELDQKRFREVIEAENPLYHDNCLDMPLNSGDGPARSARLRLTAHKEASGQATLWELALLDNNRQEVQQAKQQAERMEQAFSSLRGYFQQQLALSDHADSEVQRACLRRLEWACRWQDNEGYLHRFTDSPADKTTQAQPLASELDKSGMGSGSGLASDSTAGSDSTALAGEVAAVENKAEGFALWPVLEQVLDYWQQTCASNGLTWQQVLHQKPHLDTSVAAVTEPKLPDDSQTRSDHRRYQGDWVDFEALIHGFIEHALRHRLTHKATSDVSTQQPCILRALLRPNGKSDQLSLVLQVPALADAELTENARAEGAHTPARGQPKAQSLSQGQLGMLKSTSKADVFGLPWMHAISEVFKGQYRCQFAENKEPSTASEQRSGGVHWHSLNVTLNVLDQSQQTHDGQDEASLNIRSADIQQPQSGPSSQKSA